MFLVRTRALLGAGASVSDVFIRYFGLRALYSSLFMSCSCSCSRSWRVQVVRCPSGRLRAWRTLHIAPMAVSSHRTCCWRVRPSVCRAHFCTVRPCRLSQSRSAIILLPCILQSQPRSTARPLAPVPLRDCSVAACPSRTAAALALRPVCEKNACAALPHPARPIYWLEKHRCHRLQCTQAGKPGTPRAFSGFARREHNRAPFPPSASHARSHQRASHRCWLNMPRAAL